MKCPQLLERRDDYRPRQGGGLGQCEVVAVDLEQLRGLTGCSGGLDIRDARCERDPVVGLSVYAARVPGAA